MKDFFYCLIFPHPLNNHRARFLHSRILISLTIFFLFSSFFFPSDLNPFADKFKTFADVSVRELINLTNQKREENRLSPLLNNSALELAASKKAEDMISKHYWAHNSPDGITPWVFIKDSGYNYVYAGENLARGFSNSQDVVDAWMASPTHRENLLSPNFKDVGFSIKSGNLDGEETLLVVQEFGSRIALPVPSSIQNRGKNLNGVFGINIKPYFSTSSEIVIFMMLGFILILFVDLAIAKRKKIVRLVGHNLDHALFLTAIIFVISIFNTGAVL